MIDDPRKPFEELLTPGNVYDRVSDLESEQTEVSASVNQVDEVSDNFGTQYVNEINLLEAGNMPANYVNINWWLPLNLADDVVTGVHAMVYDGTEYVYVGGDFSRIGGVTAAKIARYSLVTRQWESIGGQLNSVVYALVLSGTDLYVGGAFVDANGLTTADYIAKYSTSGGTWSSIGGQLNGAVFSLALSGTDLYVGGQFTDADAIATADYIAKYSTTGGTWSSIGGTLNGYVKTLLLSGTDLYVGGNFTNANGLATADYIAKYSTSGGTWSSIGGQLNAVVLSLALSGTDLYVGGNFTDADAITTADYIAKYSTTGGTWSSIGGQLINAVRVIALSGDDLYVGGDFVDADGIAEADCIVKYNTGAGVWSTTSNGLGASGLSGTVYSLLALDSGSIIAGGSFNYVGAINCQSIAILCKPLNEAIDILASLFELYSERTSIAHDSATFSNSLGVNGVDMTPDATTSFTPVIEGTTTAGTGTYSTQVGVYFCMGNIVHFQLQLVWTAHTGTGNIQVGGLPYTSANNGINPACAVYFNNITLAAAGNKVEAALQANSKTIAIREIGGGAVAAIPMDTAADLRITGWYVKA